GLAQLLHQAFPGRWLVRAALIVPWAASLIMTAKLFVWIYDYYFGALNHLLASLGVLAGPVDWLGEDSTVMGAMIAVGIFVSLPFTTYVLLAGLASIPGEVYEAARVDGASTWTAYRLGTLPLLKPALLVAVVLHVIYDVYSSPTVWMLNDRTPGCAPATMIPHQYQCACRSAHQHIVLAAAPAAYYTARHRFRGRTAFLFVVLVTQMFSPTALVVGLYREFFELDLVNTYAALILTNAAFNLAFAIWILRAFFASIPKE